ncbi:hypothetical protein [Pandoraea oxalativorans]|uniref:SMODS and SLOG-associating 2TM effector domain-containing protein n=1 Tax=Pandoraea oxalativorans TaxID=573737 RepID=A0A0E3YEZ0_9BURK|nr:hypothetical protein [Pandoraea oxalativorans]AKC71216.1 hypothetical protein MB84_19690 [Pandoraea oxalativorans]
MSQQRFWRALYELIVHGYFLDAYCQESIVKERRTNVVLAVASSASLGIWAIFKQFPLIWSGIIVATQIVSATSKFLPFSARVKSASACAHEYKSIQNWAERKWCEIADGLLTDVEISKARADLQERVSKALKAHFPHGGLPDNPQLLQKGEERAFQYLNHHYGHADE